MHPFWPSQESLNLKMSQSKKNHNFTGSDSQQGVKGEMEKAQRTGGEGDILPGQGARTDSTFLGSRGSKATSWQNKINIRFKAIISFIQKINISLLSRHISNHMKHREEIQSLWKS